MPLAFSTWATVGLGILLVIIVIGAPLRLLWRLRQGEAEPAGTDNAAWRRKKKDTPEDYE
ncbi:MAG TPA: hypothetical protein VF895_00290 [Gaiellaceae bacterium]